MKTILDVLSTALVATLLVHTAVPCCVVELTKFAGRVSLLALQASL